MVLEIDQMSIPIGAIGVDQSGKRSKDGELHIGVDPMNQRYASVGQIEQHPVLVGYARRPDHTTGVLVHDERLAVVDQSVHADPPRLLRCRVGQIGVGHHHLGGTIRPHPLEPRILVAPYVVMTRGGEYVLEFEGAPVGGHKDENIGDVVDETRPVGLRVAAVAVPNSPREKVVPTVMVEQTGVEDRPITGHRTGRNERHITHAAHDRPHNGAMSVAGSTLLFHTLYSSAGERVR